MPEREFDGKLITRKVCEGTIAFIHGAEYDQKYIVVEEFELIMTVSNEKFYAFAFNLYSKKNRLNHKFLKAVKVPESIIKRALKFIEDEQLLQKDFQELFGEMVK